jgi:hypothetical protein
LVYYFLIKRPRNSNVKLYNEPWKIMSLKRHFDHLIRSIFKFYLDMQMTKYLFWILAHSSSCLRLCSSHLVKCHTHTVGLHWFCWDKCYKIILRDCCYWARPLLPSMPITVKQDLQKRRFNLRWSVLRTRFKTAYGIKKQGGLRHGEKWLEVRKCKESVHV